MRRSIFRGLAVAAVVLVAAGGGYVLLQPKAAQSEKSAAAPPPVSVSVALVEQRNVTLWDEFSGRLEAIERVEVRSRVAGAVQSVHFREGALVDKDTLLITIDPAPYQAEVDRAEAQVLAAQARVALAQTELE